MGKEEETSDELTKAGLRALETQMRHPWKVREGFLGEGPVGQS